jgi:hypothetical protein
VVTTKTKTGIEADIVSYCGMNDDEDLPENKSLVKGKIAYFNNWFDAFEEAEAFKQLQRDAIDRHIL